MARGFLQIDMLGTSFSIQSDEDSQYLEKLLENYRRIVFQIERGAQLNTPVKTAILAGIMLCDELEKIKKHLHTSEGKPVPVSELSEAERLTLKMIDSIDQVL